jgi:hypothetical protein
MFDEWEMTAYPTRICRGKYPISEPRRNAPKVKKTAPEMISTWFGSWSDRADSPVRIELKAKLTMVVEIIAARCLSAMAGRMGTYIISDFTLDNIDEDVEERHSLDHHGAVSTWEYTASQ